MSSTDTLTWPEFVKESLDILDISTRLNDNWTWEVENSEEGQAFLKYRQKINDPGNGELIQMEYHIVYSISYQVPVLYFQAHKGDGKLMSLDHVWSIFRSDKEKKYSRQDMLSVLTQNDHPIYFKPYLCLHPCRTSQILATLPKSRNRVLTFVSTMGPFLHLNLDYNYGLEYKDE